MRRIWTTVGRWLGNAPTTNTTSPSSNRPNPAIWWHNDAVITRRYAALAAALALTVAGCSDDQTKNDTPSESSAPTSSVTATPGAEGTTNPVWSTAEFAGPLPLDEFFPNNYDIIIRNQAGAIAVNKCLKERGLDPVFPIIEPTGTTDSAVDIFGYLGKGSIPDTANHPDTFRTIVEYDPLSYMPYEVAKAPADVLKALGGKDREPGGCLSEALDKVHPSGNSLVPATYSEALQLEVKSMFEAELTDELADKKKEWVQCLKDAGHPMEQADPYEVMLTHKGEGKFAEDDIKCKQSTGLLTVWRGLLEDSQKKLVTENAAILKDAKDFLNATRAEVQQYVAANK